MNSISPTNPSQIILVPGLYISELRHPFSPLHLHPANIHLHLSITTPSSPTQLKEHGITHVLSLMATRNRPCIPRDLGIEHRIIVLEDESWADLLGVLGEAVGFVEGALGGSGRTSGQEENEDENGNGKGKEKDGVDEKEILEREQRAGNRVLIHCLQGISRSGAVIIAVLMRRFSLPYPDALDMARVYRPVVSPNEGFATQLQLWADMGFDVFEVETEPGEGAETKAREGTKQDEGEGVKLRKEKRQYVEWKRRRGEMQARGEEEWNRERVRGVVGVVARMGRLRMEGRGGGGGGGGEGDGDLKDN
ncbi:phosphatases II [Pyrenochaeta sp. DS3sAY3a]|nr:phosphatases II [Pyrenochaeta sp. DS3sAY3a]